MVRQQLPLQHGGGVASGKALVQLIKKGGRIALAHDLAVRQLHDVLGQAQHFFLGVADVEDGDGQLARQGLQVGQHLGLAGGIQGGQGLVHQQQLRAGGQRPGNGHALALAAGQGGAGALQQMANAQQIDHLVQGHLAPRHRGALQAKVQIALHIQMGKQAGLLKHIAQGTAVGGQPLARGIVLPDLLAQAHLALAALQPGNAAQQTGFAAARGANQGADPAGRQLQGDIQRKAGALVPDAQVQGHSPAPAVCADLGCSQCRASSTTNANTTMPNASAWAWPYSMASTWS